jgi:hypothetical protein
MIGTGTKTKKRLRTEPSVNFIGADFSSPFCWSGIGQAADVDFFTLR